MVEQSRTIVVITVVVVAVAVLVLHSSTICNLDNIVKCKERDTKRLVAKNNGNSDETNAFFDIYFVVVSATQAKKTRRVLLQPSRMVRMVGFYQSSEGGEIHTINDKHKMRTLIFGIVMCDVRLTVERR